jgi:hypothetical protein
MEYAHLSRRSAHLEVLDLVARHLPVLEGVPALDSLAAEALALLARDNGRWEIITERFVRIIRSRWWNNAQLFQS